MNVKFVYFNRLYVLEKCGYMDNVVMEMYLNFFINSFDQSKFFFSSNIGRFFIKGDY